MRRHHSGVRQSKVLICVQFKDFLSIVRSTDCVFCTKILICKKFSLRIFSQNLADHNSKKIFFLNFVYFIHYITELFTDVVKEGCNILTHHIPSNII